MLPATASSHAMSVTALDSSPAADIEARWRNQSEMPVPQLDQDIAPRLDQLLADFPDLDTDHALPRHALRLLAAAVQAMHDAGLTDNEHLLGLVGHLLGR